MMNFVHVKFQYLLPGAANWHANERLENKMDTLCDCGFYMFLQSVNVSCFSSENEGPILHVKPIHKGFHIM